MQHEHFIKIITQNNGHKVPVFTKKEKLRLSSQQSISGLIPIQTHEMADCPDFVSVPDIDFALLEQFKSCNPALVLLTTPESAALLRVSVKKLENDRYKGRGLKFVKIAGTVRYRLSDILAAFD